MLKVDAGENGVGGDDVADALRYLVATKAWAVTQRQSRGLSALTPGASDQFDDDGLHFRVYGCIPVEDRLAAGLE